MTKTGFSNAIQSVFHRLAAFASPESLFKRQIEEVSIGLRNLYTSFLGDSYGC